MKITKLGHSCLMVEMPAPVNRTVIFDPGAWSDIDIESLAYLDDIIVTHEHADHMDVELIKKLHNKFPQVRIKTTVAASKILNANALDTMAADYEGLETFAAPHADGGPLFSSPENIGVHYLDKLTHPGDSHQFDMTCPVLALPVTAPWGSTVAAVKLGLELKPRFVIPIHDWHWSDQARAKMYTSLATVFEEKGITFCKPENSQAFVLDI